ncbi:MAG: tail fiber domain-containing protein, partial [bacterium]
KSINTVGTTVFFILYLLSLAFAQETVSITTYYPSPYGSYNELTTASNTYLATTTGNVGIGTTSSSYTLQVGQSTAGVDTDYKIGVLRNGTLASPGTYGAPAIYISDIAGDGPSGGIDTLGILGVGAGRIADGDTYASNASLVRVANDSGAAMRIDGKRNTYIGYTDTTSTQTQGLFVYGNVGIGTTSVVAKLDVAGGSANWNETTPGLTTGSLHLDPESATDHFGSAITWGASDSGNGESAQAGIYVRSDGSYGTKMYFATTDAYVTGSQTRMTILHNGNVGIGTTNPSYSLQVSGPGTPTVNITGSNGQLYVNNIAPNTGSSIYMNANVGIGTTNPSSFKLQVAGHVGSQTDNTYDLGSTGIRWRDVWCNRAAFNGSDARQKTNIIDTPLGLDFIMRLRPVQYNWIKQDDGKHQGILAQDLEKTLKNLNIEFAGLRYDQQTDTYGLAYTEFIAPLIKAVQELKKENEALKAEKDGLKIKTGELEQRITALEKK